MKFKIVETEQVYFSDLDREFNEDVDRLQHDDMPHGEQEIDEFIKKYKSLTKWFPKKPLDPKELNGWMREVIRNIHNIIDDNIN